MEALKDLAGQRELLLVGDAKLLSRGNILSMGQAQVTFIAPASKVYLPAGVLGGLDVQQASPLDYMASRDAGKPPTQRGAYRVAEGMITLAGKRKTNADLAVRCVFVWSSARAQATQSRAKKLDRAREDLQRVERGLGGPTTAARPRSPSGSPPSPPAAGHGLPSRRDGHRPGHRQAHPGVVVRPGRPGRRGRQRRLVWAADQPHL
jgi:hypothetical protein